MKIYANDNIPPIMAYMQQGVWVAVTLPDRHSWSKYFYIRPLYVDGVDDDTGDVLIAFAGTPKLVIDCKDFTELQHRPSFYQFTDREWADEITLRSPLDIITDEEMTEIFDYLDEQWEQENEE